MVGNEYEARKKKSDAEYNKWNTSFEKKWKGIRDRRSKRITSKQDAINRAEEDYKRLGEKRENIVREINTESRDASSKRAGRVFKSIGSGILKGIKELRRRAVIEGNIAKRNENARRVAIGRQRQAAAKRRPKQRPVARR